MAFPASNTIAGSYPISAYDVARSTQTYGKLIQKFGEGLKILNFLHLAGQVMDVQSETIKILEEGAPERPVTVSIATGVSAGDPITVTPATSDNSDHYLRVGFDLLIPAAYTNKDYPTPWRLYLDGSTWKAYAYDITATVDATVTTKEFIITASAVGRGSDGVTPLASGFYERSTTARLMREAGGVEGGQIFQADWKEIELANGSKGILSKLLTEMDFRLDSQIDAALLTSEINTNTALTSVSGITGATNAIPSFDGLHPTMRKLGIASPYTTNWDMTEADSIKALLEAVGVTSKELDFFVGTKLAANIEQNMLAWLVTNGASNELYSAVKKYTGYSTRVLEKNMLTFNITQLDSFSNPSKFGASEYPYADMGFIFPKGVRSVKMNGESLKLPHLTLGYAVGNTENRRRVMQPVAGINGLGIPASNAIDGVKWHSLTHIVPIFNYMNQTILVTKA